MKSLLNRGVLIFAYFVIHLNHENWYQLIKVLSQYYFDISGYREVEPVILIKTLPLEKMVLLNICNHS